MMEEIGLEDLRPRDQRSHTPEVAEEATEQQQQQQQQQDSSSSTSGVVDGSSRMSYSTSESGQRYYLHGHISVGVAVSIISFFFSVQFPAS